MSYLYFLCVSVQRPLQPDETEPSTRAVPHHVCVSWGFRASVHPPHPSLEPSTVTLILCPWGCLLITTTISLKLPPPNPPGLWSQTLTSESSSWLNTVVKCQYSSQNLELFSIDLQIWVILPPLGWKVSEGGGWTVCVHRAPGAGSVLGLVTEWVMGRWMSRLGLPCLFSQQ